MPQFQQARSQKYRQIRMKYDKVLITKTNSIHFKYVLINNIFVLNFLVKITSYSASDVKLQEYEIQASQTHVQLSVQEQC